MFIDLNENDEVKEEKMESIEMRNFWVTGEKRILL